MQAILPGVTLTEALPASKSSPIGTVRFTPAEADFAPIVGTLVLDTARARCEYLLTEFTTPWCGRAFHFEKLTAGTDAESEAYDVFCSADHPSQDSCDCRGWTYKGTCKHRDAVRSLLTNNWI